MDDPTELLTPPEPADQTLTNGYGSPLDAFNYFSPSAWINKGIASLTGFDFIEWATTWLSGDWEALSKFGSAVDNLAQAMQQLGMNVQEGMLKLDPTWEGNANDAAFMYFSELAAAISGQQLTLHQCQQGYANAAKGAWQLANQLGNLLQALGDRALLAMISAAAGTATAETGIGAVAGYGIAALLVRDMIKIINDASTIANTVGSVIVGAFGGAVDAFSQGGDLSVIPLPSAAYTVPGA